jgi:hypothetical protein
MSGGPPRPPKKTARAFDSESPGGPGKYDPARVLLEEYSRRITDPNLSATNRKKFERSIEELQKDIRERGGEP